jgi:hypothetical protein
MTAILAGAVSDMALWTPASLPSVFAWWKADSLTASNDDLIDTLADSSGNGYALAASGTSRPQYKTNVFNSNPALLFNGSQNLESSVANDWGFLHQTGGSSIVAVWQAGTTADPNVEYRFIGNCTNPASGQIGFAVRYDDRSSVSQNDNVSAFVANNSGFRPAFNTAGNNTHPANAPVLFFNALDLGNATASERSEVRINGGAAIKNNTATGTASTANPTSPLRVGSQPDGATALVGYIAELVVCNAILSTADRQLVEGYLAHKWGLTGSLPSNHPYKNAAPTTVVFPRRRRSRSGGGVL